MDERRDRIDNLLNFYCAVGNTDMLVLDLPILKGILTGNVIGMEKLDWNRKDVIHTPIKKNEQFVFLRFSRQSYFNLLGDCGQFHEALPS